MIEHANAMPAPTWHRLGVNDVDIELPDDLAFARQVEVQCAEGLLGDEGAFDAALLSMADPFPVAATPSAAAGDLGEQPAMRAADQGSPLLSRAERSRHRLRTRLTTRRVSLQPWSGGLGCAPG